jgi:hypothetical protein
VFAYKVSIFIYFLYLTEADTLLASTQVTVVNGIIDTCVRYLQEQGMRKMFIDGVTDGLDSLGRLGRAIHSNVFLKPLIETGFQEWASYRDVWKNV